MKYLIKIVLPLLGMITLPLSAVANDFTCPSLDDLKHFNGGGYAAFRLNDLGLDEKYAENEWIVAKSKFTHTNIDVLITGVKLSENDTYPFDAIENSLSKLKLVEPYEASSFDGMAYNLCTYNTTGYAESDDDDISLNSAYFVHFEFSSEDNILEKSASLTAIQSIIKNRR